MSKLVLCKECEGISINNRGDPLYDPITDYLTPHDYKRITGEDYPDEGPVWFTDEGRFEHSRLEVEGINPVDIWAVMSLKEAVAKVKYNSQYHIGGVRVLCAIGNPNPPPADWRTE